MNTEGTLNTAAVQDNKELPRFFGIPEVMEMTGWSEKTVKKLFNDKKFPSADFGKRKVILEKAFYEYFSVRHEKAKDKYWRN